MKNFYNKLINNKYNIPAIILIVVLCIGLIATYDKPLAVDEDWFWHRFFYVIAFIFVIQFLLIKFLGRVKNSSKLCCFIFLNNLISIFSAIAICSVIRVFECVFITKILHDFWGAIPVYVLGDLFWPAGAIWGPHILFYTITFAVLTTAIATPLLYFSLRNDTKSKKLLFISTLLSCAICYTCITIFFHTTY